MEYVAELWIMSHIPASLRPVLLARYLACVEPAASRAYLRAQLTIFRCGDQINSNVDSADAVILT
jgi:hypothetical protein